MNSTAAVTEDYPGRFWTTLENGRIECRLCPRFCNMKEGQRGFCYVRKNIDGHMALTTYGRSSGFCADPIEKKPLNHFYPGTSILSFGTAGCNLGCKFCQNWDISKSRSNDRLASRAMPEEIAHAAINEGCKSVAFTYNDPVIFAEYAIDTARICREMGVKTVAVTAGYITEEARGEFYRYVDAANIDLKAFTQTFYQKLCYANLDPVLKTLKYLRHETDVWIEITNLLIPGQNDSNEELHAMTDWILEELGPDVPVHFTAFHPDFKMTNIPRTPPSTLTRARNLAMAKGLQYVYVGNVHDWKGSSTYCPSCKKVLVERDWYQLGTYALDAEGNCKHCGTQIPGRFGEAKGSWHGGRQALRF
ncbi:MAG: AmmeMemoRadiSam system radical SAM enzyme [Acidobacteriota bacterium]|nr:AmmeMemoRadiSam system radical SAM enzyme [Acidobacteriota bacterium]